MYAIRSLNERTKDSNEKKRKEKKEQFHKCCSFSIATTSAHSYYTKSKITLQNSKKNFRKNGQHIMNEHILPVYYDVNCWFVLFFVVVLLVWLYVLAPLFDACVKWLKRYCLLINSHCKNTMLNFRICKSSEAKLVV